MHFPGGAILEHLNAVKGPISTLYLYVLSWRSGQFGDLTIVSYCTYNHQ